MESYLKKTTQEQMKKFFTSFLISTLLFTTISAPFAQANLYGERSRTIWQERRAAAEKLKGAGGRGSGVGGRNGITAESSGDITLLAQLPSVNLPGSATSSLGSGISQFAFMNLDPRPPTPDTRSSLPHWLQSLPLPLTYANFKHARIPPGWKPSDPIVIHIQDVHMNREAQENIGKAIQYLIDNLGARGWELGSGNGMKDNNNGNGKTLEHLSSTQDVPNHSPIAVDSNQPPSPIPHPPSLLVALEGAFGPIDLSRFREFPNQDAVRKAADYLLKENKISGPIHSAFTSPKPIPPFVGVDDSAHYHANVEAYRKSAPLVTGYKKRLAAVEKEVEREKSGVFNVKLLEFDKEVHALFFHLNLIAMTRQLPTSLLTGRQAHLCLVSSNTLW